VLVAAIIEVLDALLDDFDGRQFGSGGQGNQTHQDHLRLNHQMSTKERAIRIKWNEQDAYDFHFGWWMVVETVDLWKVL
jgi:hypothetical protein